MHALLCHVIADRLVAFHASFMHWAKQWQEISQELTSCRGRRLHPLLRLEFLC